MLYVWSVLILKRMGNAQLMSSSSLSPSPLRLSLSLPRTLSPSLAPSLSPCPRDNQRQLIKTRFAAIAPKKIKQWRQKDTRAFDGLQAALAQAESALDATGTEILSAAVKDSAPKTKALRSGTAARKRRRKKPVKKKQKRKDARVEQFSKAARFV